jgi:hypothetical protein
MTEFKPIPRRAAIDADYSKDINQLYENTLHLKNKIDQIDDEAIPNGSVTTAKINNSAPISFGNVTQAIDKDTGAVIVANGGLAVEGNIALGGQIISEIADGTAPMIVGSTTMVDNLNADTVDGKHVGSSGNTIPLLDQANTVSGVQTFTAQPAFNGGTSGSSSPFTVDSTQVVANLNADMLDDAHKSIDGTFDSNSDLLIPTEKAVKTYLNDYAMRYDYVIDSQAKFDALVASGTWLGAKNVLFAVNVTRAAQTTIPATVEKIHAINGATLTVTDLTTGQYGFGYATVPTDPKFEVRNFAVNATGTGSIYGFYSCTQLTNCTGTGTSTGGNGYGFISCNQLTNCTGTGTGTDGNGYGFYSCNQLTNCTGTGTSTGTEHGYGFHSCNQLTNCTGTGTSTVASTGVGIGFISCNQLTNCTGTGTGTSSGYGYRGCRKCMCNKAGAASTTATYHTSYATASISAPNECADTAAGGYNS